MNYSWMIVNTLLIVYAIIRTQQFIKNGEVTFFGTPPAGRWQVEDPVAIMLALIAEIMTILLGVVLIVILLAMIYHANLLPIALAIVALAVVAKYARVADE